MVHRGRMQRVHFRVGEQPAEVLELVGAARVSLFAISAMRVKAQAVPTGLSVHGPIDPPLGKLLATRGARGGDPRLVREHRLLQVPPEKVRDALHRVVVHEGGGLVEGKTLLLLFPPGEQLPRNGDGPEEGRPKVFDGLVWPGAALAHPLDDRAPQQVAGGRDLVCAQLDAQELLGILVGCGQQANPDHRLGHAEVCALQQFYILRAGGLSRRLAQFGVDVL